jgi:hypothetical protein
MRVFATVHRWWGVIFCLFFAMWFASGIVMHIMPFPGRDEKPLATGLDMSRASTDQIDYDQWTLGGDFDLDRPLKHVALNDAAGTEVYLSSASNNVVLATTRYERIVNYFGSIPHWLYVEKLRHHKHGWKQLMWWLSLLATFGALFGFAIGLVRLIFGPPYRGLRRWHHLLGLTFAPFILSWIFSGFLSMDEGLFKNSDRMFRVLHRLDFPPINSNPWLHTATIILLCLCGLGFSLIGVVLAWRRITGSTDFAVEVAAQRKS